MDRKRFIKTIGLSSFGLEHFIKSNNLKVNSKMNKNSNSYKKIAILADIHGNSFALKSILEDIDKRGIKNTINLGDIFYEPLNPHETFDLLLKHPMKHIAGNMDRYVMEVTIDNIPNPTIPLSNQTMRYVVDSIDKKGQQWIHNLPKSLQSDGLIYACHGNLLTDDLPLVEQITKEGILLKNDEILTNTLKNMTETIILCAHTHVGRLTQLNNSKIIINPGSVGLPAYTDESPFPHKMENNSPFAKYCVIEIQDGLLVSHQSISIKYDWDSASKLAEKNNRLDWKRWLKFGKDK